MMDAGATRWNKTLDFTTSCANKFRRKPVALVMILRFGYAQNKNVVGFG